ncbi:MAG: porin [Deltaproteobacteria bacterium]|nr:porin [Deltaproteobacteria bacterium]
MKKLLLGAFISGLLFSGPAFAGDNGGSKGLTISSNGSELNIRIRLQPRVDYGDIIKEKDGSAYDTDTDFYFRRARIELTGHLFSDSVRYNLTLRADKWDKSGNTNEAALHMAYIEWAPDEAYTFIIGKEKLPYSRVSLLSSAKRLLIENPSSTEAAKNVFGKTDAYYQPKMAIKGRLNKGMLAYEAAVADGWHNGDSIETGRTVQSADPLLALRFEVSPPGLAEDKKSDAHLGAGSHLTLGADYAFQSHIAYSENDFKEKRQLWGADLSGRYKGLSAGLEYIEWEINSGDPAIKDTMPGGWSLQAGYFIEGLNLEPALRYEEYDQDSKEAGKKEENTTVGLNWYFKGNSLGFR